MLKFFWQICFVFFIFNSFSLYANAAITYTLSAGRFGDNLLTYLRAEWIAYRYNITLIYVPFKYSSELSLDKINLENLNHFTRVQINSKTLNSISTDKNILYISHYFPESELERKNQSTWDYFYFPVDWKNPYFREIVKKKIAPINKIETLDLPENFLLVALHYREGGRFEPNIKMSKIIPEKFPPLQFYGDGLLKILKLFNNRAIYCHIFTDASNPEILAQQMKDYIGDKKEVLFGYRQKNNDWDSNVLEDFFSFFKFDVLIRPDSNFSIIPSLIHDYAVVIAPKSFTHKNNVLICDEFNISINDDLYQKSLQNIRFFRLNFLS